MHVFIQNLQYNLRSIFKQSIVGLNSEFSFSYTGYLTMSKEPNLPLFSHIWRKTGGLMPFLTALVWSEYKLTHSWFELFMISHILERNILSKQSINKVGREENFRDNAAQALALRVKLHVTPSEHYILPLNKSHILEEAQSNPFVHVTFSCNKTLSTEQKALKSSVCSSSFWEAIEFNRVCWKLWFGTSFWNHENIKEIAKFPKCITSLHHVQLLVRRWLTIFGECVVMDLRQSGDVHLLYLIDQATRVSACAAERSKPEEIMEEIFQVWISIYDCPEKFLSDKSGKFSNKTFRELCEKVNITFKMTWTESL